MDDGPITERGDPRDRITNQLPLPPGRQAGPIDTIREALNLLPLYISRVPAQAALTEVEHQLEALLESEWEWQRRRDRAVAAETALAEAQSEANLRTDEAAGLALLLAESQRQADEWENRYNELLSAVGGAWPS